MRIGCRNSARWSSPSRRRPPTIVMPDGSLPPPTTGWGRRRGRRRRGRGRTAVSCRAAGSRSALGCTPSSARPSRRADPAAVRRHRAEESEPMPGFSAGFSHEMLSLGFPEDEVGRVGLRVEPRPVEIDAPRVDRIARRDPGGAGALARVVTDVEFTDPERDGERRERGVHRRQAREIRREQPRAKSVAKHMVLALVLVERLARAHQGPWPASPPPPAACCRSPSGRRSTPSVRSGNADASAVRM